MWMLQLSTAIVLIVSFGLFFYNFRSVLRIIGAGQASAVFSNIPMRIKVAIDQVFAHKKLLRDFWPGLIHLIIFWGFIVLSLGTAEWMLYGLTGYKFDVIGDIPYAGFLFSQDLFNTLVFIAVAFAFYRRIFVKPRRMSDNSKKSSWDAYFILAMIWGLVISNIVTHSLELQDMKLVAQQMGDSSVEHSQYVLYASAQPAANFLHQFYGQMGVSTFSFFGWWWSHLLIVLLFLNYLPFSKHLHVILAFPNVLLSKMNPKGELSKSDLEDESIEIFGAEKVENLKWKSIMDSFACTECGRCNEFCPTFSTGKELKPKTLMIKMREAATNRAPVFEALSAVGGDPEKLEGEMAQAYEKTLVPDVFTDQFVWDCTTCGACVEACPVMIDHVDSIVEMRRALVLNRGSNPDEATNAFRNFETASNPWGLDENSRQEWLVEKGVPLFDGSGDFEYLYYIGCAGSFDDRNKKVVDSVVSVLQKAGVKFGILGKEEKCNGETARRMGNEWIAQQMMQTNAELLNGKGVKKVITSCPHCFNTLANEYPAFGGHYEVLHHSEVISDLIKSGKLKVDPSKNEKLTYHDSCYLGRYNDVYSAPRQALSAISKDKPIELKRSKQKGFCCGAGGGRMWLEETTGTRINENRAQEIVESGAKSVGVGCPFCMTMISDGLRAQEREDIQVKDIAELVAESVV